MNTFNISSYLKREKNAVIMINENELHTDFI